MSTGKYAVVRRLSFPRLHYEVWNGNNNHLLTKEEFDSEISARQWAEQNGFTIRETARSRERGRS